MRIMAFVSLGVFGIGIPVVFACLLYLYRPRLHRWHIWPRTQNGSEPDEEEESAETEERKQARAAAIGPLFACYRPSMYWFELVVTIRRLLLAGLIGFVPEYNLARGGSIELVLIASLAIQHWLVPYRRARDNRLEEFALGTAAFTFAVQSAWRAFNQLNSITDEQLSIAGNDYMDILIVSDKYVPPRSEEHVYNV